jgi:hypothetical protein
LTGYLDNEVVVPFGHNQGMKKENIKEEYVAGKRGKWTHKFKSLKKHWVQEERIWDRRIFWELKMAN